MVAQSVKTIRFGAGRLDYAQACEMAGRVGLALPGRYVQLHLERTTEATLAALARLIVLRRELLRGGGDLCIVGLSGRAEDLYRLSRLERILPRRPGASA